MVDCCTVAVGKKERNDLIGNSLYPKKPFQFRGRFLEAAKDIPIHRMGIGEELAMLCSRRLDIQIIILTIVFIFVFHVHFNYILGFEETF